MFLIWNESVNQRISTSLIALTLISASLGGAANTVAEDTRKTVSLPTGPIPVTGIEQAEFRSFDQLMLEFLQTNRIPGASLAVTRNGKLVYARGFGYADVANAVKVEPDSLFRIASISKPVTACAVLKLAQARKVELDHPAFEQLQMDVTGNGQDRRLQDITVRQLLQHTGGWDREASFDPMSRPTREATMKKYALDYPFDPKYIVQYMLDKPLDFDPGAQYAYSNFGYCILGRLIEKASGKSYEEFVRTDLLQTMGIREMQIGSSSEFRPKEVRYYHRSRSNTDELFEPSGLAVEVYESHGGWIASAVDLVRFGHENDDVVARTRRGRRLVLSPATFQTMFARPSGNIWLNDDGRPKAAWYGCGWEVRPKSDRRNIWHTGSLLGTSSLLVRRHDGLCWAVLFNTRENPDGDGLSRLIDSLVHKAANAVSKWPDRLDLFRRY